MPYPMAACFYSFFNCSTQQSVIQQSISAKVWSSSKILFLNTSPLLIIDASTPVELVEFLVTRVRIY